MKRVIEKIKLSKEQQEEVDKILRAEPVDITYHYRTRAGIIERTRSRKLTKEMTRRRLTQLLGGQCLCGHKWPEYKVSYDVGDGAKRIERYCGPCFQKRGFKV